MTGKEGPRHLTWKGWAEGKGPAGRTGQLGPDSGGKSCFCVVGGIRESGRQCLEKDELDLRGAGAC